MTNFQAKPLIRSATLGERLRELREQARLTVAQVAQQSGVAAHHLVALEAGDYSALPGDVYTRNFLQRYARTLGINEESAVQTYDAERGVVKAEERRLPRALSQPGGISLSVVGKRGAIALVVLAIVAYLGFEVKHVVSPPLLVLESPATSGVISALSIEVRGRTDPGAAVVVNGQSVSVSTDGRFQESIDLTVGRNTIQVTAAKKRGQHFTVTRDIIVEDSNQVSRL